MKGKMEKQKKKRTIKYLAKASNTSILIGDLAKMICQNGYPIGQNKLFSWLRENKYLMQIGERRNLPTQKAMQLELFEIEQRIIQKPYGKKIVMTTKVTVKGQQYFMNKLKKKDNIQKLI